MAFHTLKKKEIVVRFDLDYNYSYHFFEKIRYICEINTAKYTIYSIIVLFYIASCSCKLLVFLKILYALLVFKNSWQQHYFTY